MLVWLVMKCGSSFSLLVEMADQRPGARQGCQSSLSKSYVALHFEARSQEEKKSGDSVSTAFPPLTKRAELMSFFSFFF